MENFNIGDKVYWKFASEIKLVYEIVGSNSILYNNTKPWEGKDFLIRAIAFDGKTRPVLSVASNELDSIY